MLETEIVKHALTMAAQVAGRSQINRQQVELMAGAFEAKADVLKELIGAVVEKRVDAVRSGFSEVLGLYAEQARHFMDQQARYGDAELKSADPLERADIHKRLGEIDIELRRIRADARSIYSQMTSIIHQLDGGALALSPDYSATLSLSDLRTTGYG